jgi:hypothetical protein
MGQMANLKQLLVSLVACITVACTHAFPYYWSNDFSTTCFDVPMKPYRRHGAPTPDRQGPSCSLTAVVSSNCCCRLQYCAGWRCLQPSDSVASLTTRSTYPHLQMGLAA